MGGTFLVKRAVPKTTPPTINVGTVNPFDVNFTITNNADETAFIVWAVDNQTGSVFVNANQTSNNINIASLNEQTTYEITATARTTKTFTSNEATAEFTTPISFAPIQATGGTVTDLNIGGVNYRYHAFTSVGTSTFTVTDAGTDPEVDVLVVAGGGGGGGVIGGGGGAGGLVFFEEIEPIIGNYTVTVGNGGQGGNRWSVAGQGGSQGQNSNINIGGFNILARGGGGGQGYRNTGFQGTTGGSGGAGQGYEGSCSTSGCQGFSATQPGTNPGATIDAGNAGGRGNPSISSTGRRRSGGGGGAGQAGGNGTTDGAAGNGGDGLDLSTYFPNWGTNSSNGTTGTRGWFSGGGAGAGDYNAQNFGGRAGFPGKGGGGNSEFFGYICFTNKNGITNTGGGGGGAAYDGLSSGTVCGTNQVGGNGGSGIVIIRYRLDPPS